MSGPAGIGGIGPQHPRTFDGVSTWTWAREKHVQDHVAERRDEGVLNRDDPIQGAQILFRLGLEPEVRLDGEIRGRQVMEGRSVRRSSEDETAGDTAESNVVGFELPKDEAGAGHITALVLASEIHITFQGAADTDAITYELDGAAHYIAAAERLLGDPTVPDDPLYEAFADNAHTAAEMVARAELLRLPDHLPFKKHSQVSSRYNEWAKLGNTEMHFPKLLDSTFDWQRRAKYDRSKFSLTPAEAAACIKTLHAMHQHASRRPREVASFSAQDRFDLMPSMKERARVKEASRTTRSRPPGQAAGRKRSSHPSGRAVRARVPCGTRGLNQTRGRPFPGGHDRERARPRGRIALVPTAPNRPAARLTRSPP